MGDGGWAGGGIALSLYIDAGGRAFSTPRRATAGRRGKPDGVRGHRRAEGISMGMSFNRELIAEIPSLRAFAMALTRDREAADDLVQDRKSTRLNCRH